MFNCKDPSGIWAIGASMFELEKMKSLKSMKKNVMKYIMT